MTKIRGNNSFDSPVCAQQQISSRHCVDAVRSALAGPLRSMARDLPMFTGSLRVAPRLYGSAIAMPDVPGAPATLDKLTHTALNPKRYRETYHMLTGTRDRRNGLSN